MKSASRWFHYTDEKSAQNFELNYCLLSPLWYWFLLVWEKINDSQWARLENSGGGCAYEIIGMSLPVMCPRHYFVEVSSTTGLIPKHSALTLLHIGFQCHLPLINI
jgi:hypothetical protein